MNLETAPEHELRTLARWGASEFSEMASAELRRRETLRAQAGGKPGHLEPEHDSLLQGRSVVDRESHKLVVAGSIPAPAPTLTPNQLKSGVHGGVVTDAQTSVRCTTPSAPPKARWD